MTKAANVFEKLAKKKKKSSKKKSYTGSRAVATGMSAQTFGLARALSSRAMMGRAATGAGGISPNEDIVLNAISKNHNSKGKTYPISRFMNHPGVAAATVGAQYGSMFKSPAIGIAGGAMAAANVTLSRAIHARANIGRSRIGRTGTFASDKKVLKALKKAKV